MRLTKKKAIEIVIELWTWLAETGCERKIEWTEWDKYGEMENDCPLCQYRNQSKRHTHGYCPTCPYYKMYGCCYTPGGLGFTLYEEWEVAGTKTERKKYAKLFLEQLKQLR